MKPIYKFLLFTGAIASIASLILVIAIANKLVKDMETSEEEDEEGNLTDVINTRFPQE